MGSCLFLFFRCSFRIIFILIRYVATIAMKAFYDEALRIAFKQCYDFQPVSIDWASRPHGMGSIENEALENEDQSTKHPNLENEAPKTRKRSTQIRKTKHPKLENEAPKSRKRSTPNSKTKHPKLETGLSFTTRDWPGVRKPQTLMEIDFPLVVVEILYEF